MALNSSLPQPLVPGTLVLQRKENLLSGLPLHCSLRVRLGWDVPRMRLAKQWFSYQYAQNPWEFVLLQSHPDAAD